jgi:exodeoxyribonuclease-1
VLVPLAHVREEDFARLGIDVAACLARAEALRAAPGLTEKVRRVFASEARREPCDADAALYEGFLPDADKRLFATVRSSSPAQLAALSQQLRDPRCPELLFRYRARNWPETLDASERERWDAYRRRRLGSDKGLSEYSFDSYRESIARLRAERPAGPDQALLDALEAWGDELQLSLQPVGSGE